MAASPVEWVLRRLTRQSHRLHGRGEVRTSDPAVRAGGIRPSRGGGTAAAAASPVRASAGCLDGAAHDNDELGGVSTVRHCSHDAGVGGSPSETQRFADGDAIKQRGRSDTGTRAGGLCRSKCRGSFGYPSKLRGVKTGTLAACRVQAAPHVWSPWTCEMTTASILAGDQSSTQRGSP